MRFTSFFEPVRIYFQQFSPMIAMSVVGVALGLLVLLLLLLLLLLLANVARADSIIFILQRVTAAV